MTHAHAMQAHTDPLALRAQPRIVGFHSQNVFPLQGFARQIWLGNSVGLAEIPAANATLMHFNLSKLRRFRDPNTRTRDDLLDLFFALDVIAKMLEASQPNVSLFVSETTGNKWTNAFALLLLRFVGRLSITESEQALFRASLHRYRVVDGRIQPVHVWTDYSLLYALRYLKRDSRQTRPLQDFYEDLTVMTVPVVPADAHALPPNPRLHMSRIREVFGTLHQFSPEGVKSTAYACGSIAIQAILFSHWVHPNLWGTPEVDSIILLGIWHARRYPNETTGCNDIAQQLQDMCPEAHLRHVDFSDHMDGEVAWQRKLANVQLTPGMTRFVLTSTHRGGQVGHHMFIAHDAGLWYWFEPLADRDVPAGSMRIYDSLHELSKHAEVLLTGHLWTLTKVRTTGWSSALRHLNEAPRVLMASSGFLEPAVDPVGPLLIEQDSVTHTWRATSTIQANVLVPLREPIDLPFRIEITPYVRVIANIALPRHSIIHIRGAKLQEEPCANKCMSGGKFIDQSPFVDPAMWITSDSRTLMIGNRGAWIVAYMRRCVRNSNTTWMIGEGTRDLFLSVSAPIKKSEEIFCPLN